MNNYFSANQWFKLASLIVVPAFALLFSACSESSSSDGDSIGGIVETTQAEWTDTNLQMSDVDKLVDLSVKTEALRLEFIQMLSNGWQGDLFSGPGENSSSEKAIDVMTALMENADEYKTAIDNLGLADLTTPTTTRGTWTDIKDIFTAMSTAAEDERQKVLTNLHEIGAMGNEEAQRQLYNFLPQELKDRATDHKEFFRKLNNGDLNGQIFRISHNWRDVGKLAAGNNPNTVYVDKYAVVADEDGIPYLKSAAQVAGKIAVASGSLYFSAIDKVAGGYGAKIIELGDALDNKLKAIKMGQKLLEGKVNLQDINTFIVGQITGDLTEALGDIVGDDKKLVKELTSIIAEGYADYIKEQCTASGEDLNLYEKAAEYGNSIINVTTQDGTIPQAVMITDPTTGKIQIGIPDENGKVTIPTGAGKKVITVIDQDGKHKTQEFDAVEGESIFDASRDAKPYVKTLSSKITIEGVGGKVSMLVLTNCKYVKLNTENLPEWISGSAVKINNSTYLKLTIEENKTREGRSGTLTIEGYNDKDAETPAAKYKFTVFQEAGESQMKAEPDHLEFSAEGGTQNVDIVESDYEYYAAGIEKDFQDWISVEMKWDEGKGCSVDVTVKPNATGQTREGSFLISGSNKANPTMAERDILRVSVTQYEGDVEATVKISNIKFYAGLDCIETGVADAEVRPTRMEFNPSGLAEEIKGKLKNGILHVEAENKNKNAIYSHWLSFDIVGYNPADMSQATIVNLQYMLNSSDTHANLEATNLPFKADISDSHRKASQWYGTEANGMTVTEYQYNNKVYSISSSNYVNVNVYF